MPSHHPAPYRTLFALLIRALLLLAVLLVRSAAHVETCTSFGPPRHQGLLVPRGGSGDRNTFVQPTWRDIFERPIRVSTLEEWESQPLSKRNAILVRPLALHLTVLSSLSPLIFAGALRAGAGRSTDPSSPPLTPKRALQWTLCMASWHAAHNMINDFQDMGGAGDDTRSDSYRLAYGVHALQQSFVTRTHFFAVAAAVALPGVALSWSFRNTDLAPAFPWGLAALLLYTPLFKPFALGEVLVYLVWGPVMAGFGEIAATSTTCTSSSSGSSGLLLLRRLVTSPIASIFGAIATQMIWGKHTDKITRSDARTLPKLLGYGGGALMGCKIMLFLPYVLLAWALSIGRIGGAGINANGATTNPIMPIGSALAFIAFFREGRGTLRVIEEGRPLDGPTITENLKGTLEDADLASNYPLWFVAALGWHAITFGYLAFIGSGMEWLIKSFLA